MRDMYIYMAQFDEGNRLNSAYWHGGCEYLEQCIEDYFGIQIDRYARVNFYSFIDIVETVGGIDMEVSKAEAEGMKKPMAEQNKYLKNKKGTDYISDDIFAGKSDEDKVKLHLNGNQALAFARLRYVGNSDYERTERQRRVISEIITESKKLSLVQLDKLLNKVLPEINTDLTDGEIANLLLNAFDFTLKSDSSTFWSGIGDEGICNGDQIAANCADKMGRSTLETTLSSKGIELPNWDVSNPSTISTWNSASSSYAMHSSGNVEALLGNTVRPTSVWNVFERTILRINPNVGNITIYTPTAVNVITHTTQVGSLIRSLFIGTSQTGILLNDWNKKMKEIKITGTKWYVDIEYKENIARFGGEMCVDGFYATVNSISWIKHQGYIEKNELTELIKAVRKQNKNSSFKIEFVNDDGNEYK